MKMQLWKLFKIELDKAGLQIDEKLIRQLTPMYERWQQYIQQSRETTVDRHTEPIFGIPSTDKKGGFHDI